MGYGILRTPPPPPHGALVLGGAIRPDQLILHQKNLKGDHGCFPLSYMKAMSNKTWLASRGWGGCFGCFYSRETNQSRHPQLPRFALQRFNHERSESLTCFSN